MPVSVGIVARPMPEAKRNTWPNRHLVRAMLGMVVALALTAGLMAAMALDLQHSFSAEGAERVARRTRWGLVLVQSGADREGALASAREGAR
jgi:hypothetical protein